MIAAFAAVCSVATVTPALASPALASPAREATSAREATAVTAGKPVSYPFSSSATRIVLERTGGFAGTSVSYVVDRSTAGGREPLRLAGSNDFRRLRGSYLPANACCDRYAYRVTVTWRGGQRKTVSTVQGTAAPSILWTVIQRTQQVGAQS
ncbi:protealysin inhibitor emfourin [Paractinoplanes ferrugineus]|nr:protealysin inhibitor emfourin [Actinoplanes ferrugineus]